MIFKAIVLGENYQIYQTIKKKGILSNFHEGLNKICFIKFSNICKYSAFTI